MRQYYLLSLLLICITSCRGQEKVQLPTGHSKIIKTQRKNQYISVRCGLQDRAGNLWFGTTGEGIYRYDGTSFINFLTDDGLSSNYIWCICEDTAGNIWFGTADGISRYDGVKFTAIPMSAINGSNTNLWYDNLGNPSEVNAIWDIVQDRSGTFWIGTTKGVFRYDGIAFTRFSDDDGVKNTTGVTINKIEYILEDNVGNIWFSGRMTEGLFRFDGTSLTNYKPFGKSWLWPQVQDKAGNIWFSNWSGAYRYDGKSFTKFNDKDSTIKVITCIFEDRAGNLWFGGDLKDASLFRYDGNAVKLISTKDGPSKNSVWSVVEDRAGNLWFGTRDMGLYRYDGKTFTSFAE